MTRPVGSTQRIWAPETRPVVDTCRHAESHATSRLTAASVAAAAAAVPGREESVYDPKGRYRLGIPPKVPSFDGKRDPVIIKKWVRKVAVWLRLSSPYPPREEMGLRLWQDGLAGRTEEVMQDDDWEIYFAKDGVEKVGKRVLTLFGEDAMVELGSRIDKLFDHLRRGDREMLVDFLDRFEKAYKQYVEAGEVLSERARLNRFFRGSRLRKHEQREILMDNRGRWEYDGIVAVMRQYNEFYGRPSERVEGIARRSSSLQPRTAVAASDRRPATGGRFGSATRSRGRGGRGHKVNEAHEGEDLETVSEEDQQPSADGDEDLGSGGEGEPTQDGDTHEVHESALPYEEESAEDLRCELRCELCEAEAQFRSCYSVCAVTPGVKQRYERAGWAQDFAHGSRKADEAAERDAARDQEPHTVQCVRGVRPLAHEPSLQEVRGDHAPQRCRAPCTEGRCLLEVEGQGWLQARWQQVWLQEAA